MKPVQYFSPAYLEQCRDMSAQEILDFLEAFRLLQEAGATQQKSKLISMKIQENLLNAFRRKCDLTGVKYQTRIKQLMQDWVESETES